MSNSRGRIYLAGPIKGLGYHACTDWRERFTELVGPRFVCLSPMRGKEYLLSSLCIGDDYPQEVMSCQRGIMSRDFFDTCRADVVVANLRGAETVSIGTVMEIAWAYAKRVPLIAVMEPEGNLHDHGMIREAISFRVTSLEQAAHVAKVVIW